jgi:hypothetical protein
VYTDSISTFTWCGASGRWYSRSQLVSAVSTTGVQLADACRRSNAIAFTSGHWLCTRGKPSCRRAFSQGLPMTSTASGAAWCRDQTARFLAKPLIVARSCGVLPVPVCRGLNSGVGSHAAQLYQSHTAGDQLGTCARCARLLDLLYSLRVTLSNIISSSAAFS